MRDIALLEEYLQGLYEMYDEFEKDYRTLHKRSQKHNSETIGEYYMRWKKRLREEIRKAEKELVEHAKYAIVPELEIAS